MSNTFTSTKVRQIFSFVIHLVFRLKIRKLRKINKTEFMSDIVNSELIQAPYKTASLLSHQYFHTLRNILDKHAPVHECKTPQHVNKGFINSEILAAKRRKRKLEREWRKDNSAINRSRYRAAVNHFNRLVECAKTKHYSDMVRENEDNPKALWNSIKKVLHRSPKMVLPDYTTMNSLVNIFGRYFADKFAKLRSGLLSTDADPPVSGSYKNKFVSFRTMSEEEVLKIIKSTPLKLNPDKTEFIVIGDDQIRSSLKSSFPVSLLGNTMEPAESVKNLGVILDAGNSMQRHVANLCRISYYLLRELRRVHRYLNHETAVKVANALVSSRLDYCNSLLYNTKKAYTSRLQRVQNALCRTVCKLNKYCHVTPFLHKLHWLPIHYRILFKYNLLICKAIHLSQPPYLSALIRRSDLTRGNRLSISSSKPNKRSGLRSFIAGAPTEWNKLPQAIRTIESISGFRKQLKTYVFRLAYPPP